MTSERDPSKVAAALGAAAPVELPAREPAKANGTRQVGPDTRAPEPAAQIEATPWIWRDPLSIEPRAWLYGRHLIRRFTSATVAAGGVGKSALLMVEIMSMVTGLPLLGIKPDLGPLRVWYWNGEDPREEIDRRLAAICRYYDISADNIGGRLFIDTGRETEIVIARQEAAGTVIAVPVVEALVATIMRNRIDVIITDPFVSCHRVPENDNGAIDSVAKIWGGIADRCNSGIELVHHLRKAGGGQHEREIEDARGPSR